MTRITTRHIYMASLVIASAAMAETAYEPVKAGTPLLGSQEDKTVLAKSSKAKMLATVSPPESGVELLTAIFKQTQKNAPQIAMQQQKAAPAPMRQNEAASNIFSQQNATDYSLVIKPKAITNFGKAQRPAAEPMVAMAPRKAVEFDKFVVGADKEEGSTSKAGYYSGQSQTKSLSTADRAKDMNMFQVQPTTLDERHYTTGRSERKQVAEDSYNKGWGKLQSSANKLFQIANLTQEAQEQARRVAADEMDAAPGGGDAGEKVIKTGNRTRGALLSVSPKVVEYTGGEQIAAQPAGINLSTTAGVSRMNVAPFAGGDSAYNNDLTRSVRRDADGAKGETSIKLDQPGAFRYIREIQQQQLGAPAEETYADTKKKEVSFKKARGVAIGGMPPVHIAYVPPSLVAGIPGLRLGCAEGEVEAYLKGRGNVARKEVNGWKVLSLSSSAGKTALQVYVRDGVVEAFRVFDQAYVPDRLGLALGNSLSSMKEKFGEAAFKLDEPRAKGQGVWNYVYPVSQVSFQLARPNPKEKPTIQSLLLFQFL